MTTQTNTELSPFKRMFYRPPFIGMLAFAIVFIMQGFGHTQMILMEMIFPSNSLYLSAFITGLIGAVALWIAMRSESEVTATWVGFFAGTFLWTGWIEFAFVWSAHVLLGVDHVMKPYNPEEIATKGEYIVMMSSVGVLLATLMPLTMNRETKCNMFQWFQRRLGMRTGKPSSGYKRNFGYITALETIYVLWFCYLMLLFLYDDKGVFGLSDRHPVAIGFFVFLCVWSLYLINRLRQMWKVTTAIRYAIPTAIIAFSAYEILGRWESGGPDFWVEPGQYALVLSLILGGLIAIWVIAALIPAHVKSLFDKNRRHQQPKAG